MQGESGKGIEGYYRSRYAPLSCLLIVQVRSANSTLFSSGLLLNIMMQAQLPSRNTVENYIDWMKLSIRKGMYRTLLSQGLLAIPFDVEDTQNKMFLEEYYGVSVE